jgi:hypothetical protein
VSERINVVYREEPDTGSTPKWSAYSYPVGVYASGSSLEHVRDQFAEAAAFHLQADDLDAVELYEHIERPLGTIDGVFMRVAIDRRTLDREDAARAMRASLSVLQQRDEFIERAYVAATGDVVVVACLPADLMTWVFDQMGPYDALQVCVAGPGRIVWWNALMHHKATGVEAVADSPTTGELGLSSATATVSDFIRSDISSGSRNRPLVVSAAS